MELLVKDYNQARNSHDHDDGGPRDVDSLHVNQSLLSLGNVDEDLDQNRDDYLVPPDTSIVLRREEQYRRGGPEIGSRDTHQSRTTAEAGSNPRAMPVTKNIPDPL
ncbi:hypothetical protein N8I77_010724 [Diaporthe amygdali]|uniref:Uncharacterized protein n=1 Tax=Phomopsis amygdali TaxID=1214568 RepID=A0AAD9S928_PHOAM|nr:hypothetical protein N8I77_010724 [Diaporthe amygdali]